MWCWLYPVAFTLSRDWINAMWDTASPKWIEGFITKEEAESSLQDAGNLVVTYIGNDYIIHNRLLSLDFIYSSGEKKMTAKPLQDMLLAEPEAVTIGKDYQKSLACLRFSPGVGWGSVACVTFMLQTQNWEFRDNPLLMS
ncbi:hypothetical protein F0562_009048 [Nyssa sinensis]|uniref:Uncharacterized protein n=1 Tax=Nyssa sinensis TaxID=561372 RepID=A0A5J5A756_9ASTE|nr:hypothetical protein F0562_009048 [Nyssa sinensis]